MIRFADPTRCPDCGRGIPPRAPHCQGCGLMLSGELPGELFAMLREADALLARMRQASAAALQPSPSQSAPLQPGPSPSPTPPFPAPTVPQRATGISSATVPRILLGLGALCLVVAALIFLAVTWSALGIAGRTAILLGLTAGAFAGAQLFARKPLPAAAESFTVIGLAFAALSLTGAASADWLPSMGGGALAAAHGALLAVLGLATAESARRIPGAVLYSGEIALGLGAALIAAGGSFAVPRHLELVLVIAVVAAAGVALASRRPLDGVRRALFLALAAGCWLALAAGGLARAIRHAGVDGLWAQGNVWPLLAAAALAGALIALPRIPHAVRVTAATVAVTLAWIALWLPISAIDEDTVAVAATLAPLLLAAAATYGAPARWRVVPSIPLVLSALVPAAAAIALCVMAVGRVEEFTPLTAAFDARFPASDAPISPLLLPLLVAALILAAVAAARLFTNPLPLLARGRVPIGAALALAIVAAIALDPAPIALVVGLALVIGVGLTAWALRGGREQRLWLAAAVLALALWWSSPGAWFAAIALAVVAALAAVLSMPRHGATLRAAGDAILPLALAGALWLAADLAGLVPGARALTVVVVLGVLAIARPRRVGELATGGAMVIAVVGAAGAADTEMDSLTWLAVNLTVGGALVGAHSLRSADPRPLRRLAGALLLLASWIRLGQIGVSAPEAYTLPAALVLLAAGLWALRAQPHERTQRALSTGLLLALVPSLLWSLADPVSLRALLLGLACVALVLVGAQLSWSAPLVYGATTGAILALREAAPWAAQVNPWIATGLIGLLLTGVGITWERRLQEIRLSRGYLARLR